ncbi:hypothetical protein AB2L28_12010 [Kineococcus sp. TBRC 1896]|uniref:Pilus assembly protein PilO n=1 Tax=Kineococcus mangrovi TaxID=1660183 RepID=A0ABV4I6W0_9ACTN
MSISKSKTWAAGAAVLSLLVLVATWFLVIGPKRAEAADLATDTSAAQAQNEQIAQQTELLKAQFATLPQERAALAEIRSQFPSAADVPALLRTLESFAGATGVTITAIQPGAIAPYSPTGADASTAVAPAATPGGLSAIPLTLTVSGTFAQTELFVKQAQADMKRYFLLDTVALSTDQNAGASGATSSVTSTIGGKVFVLPDTAASAAPVGDGASTTVTSNAQTPVAGDSAPTN